MYCKKYTRLFPRVVCVYIYICLICIYSYEGKNSDLDAQNISAFNGLGVIKKKEVKETSLGSQLLRLYNRESYPQHQGYFCLCTSGISLFSISMNCSCMIKTCTTQLDPSSRQDFKRKSFHKKKMPVWMLIFNLLPFQKCQKTTFLIASEP